MFIIYAQRWLSEGKYSRITGKNTVIFQITCTVQLCEFKRNTQFIITDSNIYADTSLLILVCFLFTLYFIFYSIVFLFMCSLLMIMATRVLWLQSVAPSECLRTIRFPEVGVVVTTLQICFSSSGRFTLGQMIGIVKLYKCEDKIQLDFKISD